MELSLSRQLIIFGVWSCWDAPYLRPFSTLGCFSVPAKGERIFGWDSHCDPAGKTWKLHGMVSLGKRNFPFAITHRRRRTFYCPASGFVPFQVQNDSETLAKERNPICQPILNDSQFSQIHIHFLFPSSPLSLAPPPQKEKIPAPKTRYRMHLLQAEVDPFAPSISMW